MDFNRIIYPERAEYLNEGTFRSYKIFLNHWQTLSTKLKSNFEEALLRRVSKTLIVFGEQSSGKTLFANKITQDFIKTSQVSQGTTIDYDEGNIWHQIVSGFGKNVNLIRENTTNSALIQIEDDSNWVNKVKEFCKNNSSRTCLIIADNCERDYFVQGIRGMTDEQFLQIGRTQEMIVASAQRFVALCRTELRGAVIVMFTNDDLFALAFQEEVNKQHQGLVETTQMPMPGAREKETVVRVNTNRLNPFSYWYCLDRAGVPEKKNVFHTILSANGFKEVFEAVDQAIQKASPTRIGRPPKKCLLTLFVLTNRDDIRGLVDSLELGEVEHNVNENQFIDVVTFKDRWTDLFDVGDQRKASLLKSEWNFRIVVAGNPFTSLLLSKQSPENAKAIIEKSLKYHGPGTQITTLDTYRAEFDGLVTICGRTPYIPLEHFWAAGQPRSSQYEQALKEIFPSYNTNSTGFLVYRPDLVIEPYSVCELSLSPNDNDSSINLAIKRKSLVCEFTASKDLTLPSLQTYLNRKLSNYVEILEEQ